MTLGEFIDRRYAPWAHASFLNPNIGEQLKADFAGWLEQPLDALTTEQIDAWRKDRLEESTQPLAVSRMLRRLQVCLTRAVDWEVASRNPLQVYQADKDAHYLVELFAGGNGYRYLRDGWSSLGVDWTWTSGPRAVLELPYVECDGDFMIKMGVVGILKSPVHPFQRITVRLNDTIVGKVVCRGAASYEFHVPGALIASQKRVHLALLLPDADFAFDSAQRKDMRHMSLQLKKIEIQRLPKSNAPSKAEIKGVAAPKPFDPRPALQEMNDPEALIIRMDDNGDYIAENKIYGFWYHTFVNRRHGITPERIRRNEYVRIGMLLKSLFGELSGGTKLFVYHDADQSTLEDVRKLADAINEYGNNTLLWIVSAPAPSLAGTARQIEPGLIQGFVSGFQSGDIRAISPHVDSWVAMAYQAHRIWVQSRAPKAEENPQIKAGDAAVAHPKQAPQTQSPAPRPRKSAQTQGEPTAKERSAGAKMTGTETSTRPA